MIKLTKAEMQTSKEDKEKIQVYSNWLGTKGLL